MVKGFGMPQTIIAANWKMNHGLTETACFLADFRKAVPDLPSAVLPVICPAFPSLALASTLLNGSGVPLGAQNMSEKDSGAFTGEVSASMLLSVGCEYVILGHSERRHIYGETDPLISKKVRQALKCGLIPILCVGETLEQRQAADTMRVLDTQLTGCLEGVELAEANRLVVAYEPVWAIGTGINATPEQASEAHVHIRQKLVERFGSLGAEITIQYGGSVKPDNASAILRAPEVNGALVGGASLNVDSFCSIIRSVTR